MKTIVCYGDSNTFGAAPTPGTRLERHVRWTGQLQRLLGEDYYVVEEGLGGRTTAFEDPVRAGRNGLSTLMPILQSHQPMDLLVFMLGTNDLKPMFAASPYVIRGGMEALVTTAKNPYAWSSIAPPEILLLSPIHIGPNIDQSPYGGDFEGAASIEKSRRIAPAYMALAQSHNLHFFDAATVASACGEDSIHIAPDSHGALAHALAEVIRGIV